MNEPWHFTDDTVMAIGIYRVLEKYGKIDQDELAKVFAENYALDWHRGYGGTAHSILRSIGEGKDWREVAPGVFDGMGSILERERLFCAMSQINCRKVIPNIKYCLRLPLKRRAA